MTITYYCYTTVSAPGKQNMSRKMHNKAIKSLFPIRQMYAHLFFQQIAVHDMIKLKFKASRFDNSIFTKSLVNIPEKVV